MTNKLTLFHDASKGGKKQWSIWIEPDGVTVTVEWGLVGHTLQRSSDRAKVKGKVGTKAFKDEAACALENYERQVRKKRESGYVEADAPVVHRDVLVSLDKNFVPAKPIMDYTEDDIRRLDGQGRLVFQRKRDGRRHLALIDKTATISIYSRRMEDLTGHLAFIVDELDGMPFPPGTILDGEIIIDNEGTDDFPTVGSFTNPATKPIDAIRTAAKYNVRFMLFDVLYLGGVETWKQPYSERYALLQHAVPMRTAKSSSRRSSPVRSTHSRCVLVRKDGKASSRGSRTTRPSCGVAGHPSARAASNGSPSSKGTSSPQASTTVPGKSPTSRASSF
jgi:ATP-dependent DNA ligase